MGMVTFRIPNELRQEMSHVKINWSAYVRQAISEVVDSQRKQRLIQALHLAVSPKNRAPSGTAAGLIRTIRAHG